MYGQTTPMLIGPLAACRAGSVASACRWSGTGAQLPGRLGSLRWNIKGQNTTITDPGQPDFPVITQSAGARWNGSPAARDFG